MKALFSLLLVLAFSFSAFAGNEGPQAAPKQQEKMIAELSVVVMFGNPSLPWFYSYQIYANGYTQLVTQMRDSKEKKIKALKPYRRKDAQEIRDLVKEIVPGKLFDGNPTRPSCMDAPTTNMRVLSNNQEIMIAQYAGCKAMNRENRSHADEKMINILNELSHSAK